MRARMALLASGTVCEIREVKLREKPAEMIAASPKGTVPVLVLDDNAVIDESIDIMRWALRRADPEGWLDGDDAPLIGANDGPFKHHLDRYKYPDRHGSDAIGHRAEGLAMLAELERRLAERPFLCGERRMLADMAIMPFVRQFAAVDRDWFDAQPVPGVRRWLAGLAGSALFELAMVNRPQWRPGDPPVHLA
jgi:glutathione S-transferase